MNPSYIDRFLSKYAPRKADLNSALPLGSDQLLELGAEVRKISADLKLAKLSAEQRSAMSNAARGNIRKLALLYAQLFRRRPDIAQALGVDQKMMEQLQKREISLGALVQVAMELETLAADGKLLLTAAIAEANQHVSDTATILEHDPTLSPDQHRSVEAAQKSMQRVENVRADQKKTAQKRTAKAKQDLLLQQKKAAVPLLRDQAKRELLSGKDTSTTPAVTPPAAHKRGGYTVH